jgi:large subunit ribosomal protein L23
MKDMHHILQLHLITEKSTAMKEATNAYVFRVNRQANKKEIMAAVEKVFGVKVESVRTMIVPGKPKRVGRFLGKTTAWKKAIVKLKVGQQIAAFENA